MDHRAATLLITRRPDREQFSAGAEGSGGDAIITPLPDGVRLLYRTLPLYTPQEHVCEFTVEEVLSMNLHELDYYIAADLYEDIWEDVPGESQGESPAE